MNSGVIPNPGDLLYILPIQYRFAVNKDLLDQLPELLFQIRQL
jgi:hypothetical protein